MTHSTLSTYEIRIAALPEETILTHIGPLLRANNIDFTLSSSHQEVAITLRYSGTSPEMVEQHIAQIEQKIRSTLANVMFPASNGILLKRIGMLLEQQNLTLATIESLTGGLIASALTDMHESSAHFLGGVVAYSSLLKERMGVPHAILEQYGVISAETAEAMAQAICKTFDVEIGLGITGVAGPDEQEGKPVGTVYIGIAGPYGVKTCMGSEQCAGPDREENKQAATLSALHFLKTYLEKRGNVE